MLVGAAYITKPEILLSASGKENLDFLNQRLLAARPDSALLLGLHGSKQADQLSLDLSDKYRIEGRDFYPDFQTIETVQRELRRQDFPLTLDSNGQINAYLAQVLYDWPEVRLIPLSSCELGLEIHDRLSEHLKDWLINSPKRIVVLAVAEADECRALHLLNGLLSDMAVSEINIADQAIFYGC